LQSQYVKAHSGVIGNEIADSLAGDAAEGKPLADLSQWLADMMDATFCSAIAWFWTLYSPQFQGWHHTTSLCLPQQADTRPTLDVLPLANPGVGEEKLTGLMDCIVGTCNVLTLCPPKKSHRDDSELGLHGLTRQQLVFDQFRRANVCIFALQETRLRRMCKTLQDYLVFRGDATSQGQHGVLIAISTVIPYGHY